MAVIPLTELEYLKLIFIHKKVTTAAKNGILDVRITTNSTVVRSVYPDLLIMRLIPNGTCPH